MKKILVTDDDPRMVEIIKSAFEPFEDEFELITANNGQSALKRSGNIDRTCLFLTL